MAKPGVKPQEKYVDTLDSVSRKRYESKLSAVGGLDPYENGQWSDDVGLFPPVAQDDISDYLVHRTSYYTRKSFKANKQLGAHNQQTSGWVKKLFAHKPRGCDNTIITAEVFHSQSLCEKPLKPWVIIEEDGTVLTAHCNCMAGIAESCSHIAAVLFTVDASVRIRDSQTPTQVPAGWVVPPTKDVVYRKAADIDFTSAATKKRRLDGFINGTPTLTKAKRKQTNVAAPTKDELNSFFEAIQFSKTGVKPAVLSLVPEYATDYKNQQATVRMPKFLGDLEDEEQVQRTYSEVLQHCENVDISVTEEQCIIAERETRAQRNSKTWARLRTGRITASRAHQALHTNPAKPSMSLISLVCRPKGPRKETASMQWGIEKEHIALSEYEEMASKRHKHFQLDKCGLFIHAQFPFLGASPDGVRYCSCCGRGCVEVKCPASKASCTISECLEDPKFYLEKRDRGLSLMEKHEYYTQVQLQMFVTKTELCDFVVWTPKDLAVVKVEYDPEFMQDALEKLAHVYQVAILPELVGKVFSRARPQPPTATNTQSACPLALSPTKGSAAQLTCSGSPVKLFCYCKRGEEEDAMVACDNENCKLEWFHFFCVGIKSAPKGQWYCPDCRQLPEFRRTGKSKPKVLSQQRL